MDTPILSMIIPVYNARAYLATLVRSLCAQTDTRFEAVFVDDGSTDGSYDELCRLTENVPFGVTFHRQENGGVSVARNVGVTLANGEFLSFVDSDDALHPYYVATLAEQTTANVAVFRSIRKGEGEPLEAGVYEETIATLSAVDLLTRFVGDPPAISMCYFFIRRAFYEERAHSFREGYQYYEDYELFCRTVMAAGQVSVAERDLYFYIQRGDSAMTRFTVDRLSSMRLIEALQPSILPFVPAFRFLLPRLYWSVMWQASVAFSVRDACRFAQMTQMRDRLRPLRDYPGRKVRLSSRLFQLSPLVFVLAARAVKRGAKKQKADLQPFAAYVNSK